MQDFPKNYSFDKSEKKLQEFWQKSKIFHWNPQEKREDTFVVDTPPPTVSGNLHIGHVYSYTQTDFIVRFHRMRGKNIFYPIGFDDNGLPTERLVEKKYNIRAKNIGKQAFSLLCQDTIKIEEEKFKTLFKKIALSTDPKLEYQTISPFAQKIAQTSFLELAQKGEIYYQKQPILWDIVDSTALAQTDIEEKERMSIMYEILLDTDSGKKFNIATTRPELLPACVAILYNPADIRYQKLKDHYAITPLFNYKVPIISDELVVPTKGSGLVMCCTFGDSKDIIWWKKYNLPLKSIINKNGILSLPDSLKSSKFYSTLNNIPIKDAKDKILELLNKEKLVIAQKEISQIVRCAERSGTPIEIVVSPQWFVNTKKHKNVILEKLQQLSWNPKNMKKKLENWVNGIAWDWCISRQRYFGVPIPVWYSKRNGEEGKILFADLDQLPVNPMIHLPKGYTKDEVLGDQDVLDTWATSSLTPQLNSKGISEMFCTDKTHYLKTFPADLRPQAHEILRTWAFYTILKAHLHSNMLPWKNIMISGWCLTSDKNKMSKSKDNIIEPEKLINQYGADAIRYWSAKSKLGSDTIFSEDALKNGKRLINKLWNASKFCSLHFNKLTDLDRKQQLSEIKSKICHEFDQFLISKLYQLVDRVEDEFMNYEYSNSIELIENFFWTTFCDNYLEIIKTRIYNDNSIESEKQYSAIITIWHALAILLKLLAPFLPYITEEIWQILYSNKSIHEKGTWPKTTKIFNNLDHMPSITLITIIELVRKFKSTRQVSIKTNITSMEIISITLPQDLVNDLKNTVSAKEIRFVKNFSDDSEVLEKSNVKVMIC